VCDDLVDICNKHYRRTLNTIRVTEAKVLGHFFVPIAPMEKPRSQTVAKDKGGNMIVVDTEEYIKYVKDFKKTMINCGMSYPTLMISEPCQVTALFYTNSRKIPSLTAYLETLLECLVYSGITQGKGYNIVRSTDGSKIMYDQNRPRIEIIIKKVD
jgi:hypothetical protein